MAARRNIALALALGSFGVVWSLWHRHYGELAVFAVTTAAFGLYLLRLRRRDASRQRS
jgi:hypothetical protein